MQIIKNLSHLLQYPFLLCIVGVTYKIVKKVKNSQNLAVNPPPVPLNWTLWIMQILWILFSGIYEAVSVVNQNYSNV